MFYDKFLRKINLTTSFVFLSILVFGQKIDTVLNNGTYKSYFNYTLKEPVYVSYTLYHGGGDCDRSEYNFKNDTKIKMARQKDYAHSGYDQGHLTNAEDFAYDCEMDEETFRFYNCLPQTPNLNRGIWKVWEEKIREKSQTDSLEIVCGGKFGKKTIGDKVAVPDYCFKIVKSLKTNTILHVLWFTNKVKNNTVSEIEIDKLWVLLGYKIVI